MPKVTYSATKGIVQSSGSGFIINDVSITEGSEDIVNGGTCNAYGINVLAGTATLPNGETAGQKATVIFAGADLLTVTSGTNLTGAAGAVHVFVWNGSAWKKITA